MFTENFCPPDERNSLRVGSRSRFINCAGGGNNWLRTLLIGALVKRDFACLPSEIHCASIPEVGL